LADEGAKRSRLATLLGLPWSRLTTVGVGLLVAIVILVIIGSFFNSYPPNATTGSAYSPPSSAHLFGTDYLGRDLLSQIAWGAYPSLFVSIGAALGSVLLGFVVGVFGGYYTRLEGLLGGTADVVMAFPAIPLLMMVGSLYPATDFLIAGLLTLVLWPPVARVVRAQVSSVKKLPYVDAARTSGMGDVQTIFRVIVPEVGSLAIAYFIINIPLAVIITTALEFLGVGNPTDVSWGTTLYWAQQTGFTAGAWWWIVAPGLIIALTATGFAFIGFALEERMNPRLRAIV
jgi:peptide/nickel transport system permease protein